jgi:hydrogenase expression/formation protein HypC
MEVGLAFVPEAGAGDWVLVHAGFALNVLDEQEAIQTWKYLKEADLVGDLPADLRAAAEDVQVKKVGQ